MSAGAQSPLTVADCQTSLALGTQFLLQSQREAGNFEYEYNWKTQRYSTEDHQVRQAGTAWSLALIQKFHPAATTEAALRRALDFFHQHSRATDTGSRYITYPDGGFGHTGTVALVTLAHLDYLATLHPDAPPYRQYRERADAYLAFLRELQRSDGLWPNAYTYRRATAFGRGSPYADGEALLAFAKAAKYHQVKELRGPAIRAAKQGYARYVSSRLARSADPTDTKAFYQWATMAYFELATTGWPDTEVLGDHVLTLADWMVHEHKTLERTRNTGYAYEGLIHAYRLAELRNDQPRCKLLGELIPFGLAKLTSWQVGHPLANAYVRAAGSSDVRATGGVQNHRREPQLRVDVTQHQMHAVILALQYVFPPTRPGFPAGQ